MVERSLSLVKVFMLLWLFSGIGIFLHELAHHLLGLRSMMSLARNWPLEVTTTENMNVAIIGSLAGPTMNLFLSYIGLIIYKYFTKTKQIFGLLLGVTNSFIVISAAAINLIVDLISGTMGNDLQVVSKLLNLNVFILPVLFVLLSLLPFFYSLKNYQMVASNKTIFVLLLVSSWLLGESSLMLLDSVFTIRFSMI